MQQEVEPEELPDTIYRYRSFNPEIHLNPLLSGTFWFSHADSFNDPFDLNWGFDYSGSFEEMKQWAINFLDRSKPYLTEAAKEKIASVQMRELEENPEERKRRADYIVEMNKARFGVCCFSGIEDDILMWSHYSNKHTGFCFGVDTRRLEEIMRQRAEYNDELLEVLKVDYRESIPQINFFEALTDIDDGSSQKGDIKRFINTKSSHWAYEKEYRLVYWDHPATAYQIGIEPINEVYLGCRVSDEDRAAMIKVVESKNSTIELYQFKTHETRFELTAEQII
jgi:hypothetical protein